MINIAILGFGTVGSGVYAVLQKNAGLIARRAGQEIRVKRVLVLEVTENPELFTSSINDILNDPEITMVAEAIGGVKAAYPYVKALLASGRSVVTSNKELVATHGAELLALAKEKGVAFLFEASVGGGMPLITPMCQSLLANQVEEVYGIVNGTTNYMLTRMSRENMDFAAALKEAQQLGYAETKDPSDDVDGPDACRKIAILASLAFGKQVHTQNIPTRGIRGLEPFDLRAAARLGCAVKLIAWARQTEAGPAVGVEPMLVPLENQLAGVEDVFNGVLVRGDMVGDVFFYGRGAGKLPTASAIAADLVLAAQQGAAVHDSIFWEPSPALPAPLTSGEPATYYVRVKGLAASMLPGLYGPGELVADDGGQAAYLAENITPKKLYEAARQVKALGGSVQMELRRLEQ